MTVLDAKSAIMERDHSVVLQEEPLLQCVAVMTMMTTMIITTIRVAPTFSLLLTNTVKKT